MQTHISPQADANFIHKVSGLQYVQFMAWIHQKVKPQSYLEIGVFEGATLNLAQCPSIAIDPNLRISSNVIGSKPSCLFFQCASDDFFSAQNPKALLGTHIDLAFLDGMHLYEYLLRDFINTERFCHRKSIILLHDCLPPGFYMTLRDPGDPLRKLSPFSDWWTGDVWKVVLILRKYRPDLTITVTDCTPTGLVLVTNLDPHSSVLSDNYQNIVTEFAPHEGDRAVYEKYMSSIAIAPSHEISMVGTIPSLS